MKNLTTEVCRRLGLSDPAIPVDVSEEVLTALGDSAQRGHFVPPLLKVVDAYLARTGLRLLGIELDTDELNFTPVTGEAFASLAGRDGDGLTLYDMAGLWD